MASIKFYQRTSKKLHENAPIRVKVMDSGSTFWATTHLELPVKFFNREQKTNPTKKTLFPMKLSKSGDMTDREWYVSETDKLEKAIRKGLQTEAEPTSEWLAELIDRTAHPEKYETKPPTLFEWIEVFTKESKKTGRVSYRIIKDYEKTLELLKKYDANKERLTFENLDRVFYIDFVEFLKDENYKPNTIGKNIKNLKTFLNEATRRGLNSNMAFQNFKKISEDTDAIYLTPTELDTIYKTDLSKKPTLERVRDLFIVGCWTGLRFGDLSRVKPENIKDGFIEIAQAKTKGRVVIPLHPVVLAILEKYNGELPKAISNQKTNEYLKEIGELAKINEPIHITETIGHVERSVKRLKWELIGSHTARRSFATNQYRSGFPAQSLMKITGHTTERAFLKYIRLSDKEHAILLQTHWQKQAKHLKVV